MAIYYLDADVVRRSLGHSSVAASAYAAGMDLYDERADQLQAYGRKRGVFHTEIVAPENAPDWVYDRQALWNRAERAEKRVDAQPARMFVLALPHELTDEQKIELVTAYARDVLTSEGMVVDMGFHRSHEKGDQRNDHAHLVVTMRELDGDGFAAKKNRDWNRKETLEYWREAWADYQNDALEDAGFDARVDHRTLEEQGIDRESTIHMGKEATEMEREGIATDLGDKNREITERNQTLEERLQDQAAIAAESARDLALALEEPDTFSFPTAQSSEPEPALLQREQAVSAFIDKWTLAYMMEEPPALEKRQAENERRWYDSFYSTIETIQETAQRYWTKLSSYWQRYVVGKDKDLDQEQEPDSDFGR
jgi:hypothetical protein